MARRKKAPTVTPEGIAAGLAGKSLAQVAAEARALGLTYGQYTALVNTGTLERWRRNAGRDESDKGRKDYDC